MQIFAAAHLEARYRVGLCAHGHRRALPILAAEASWAAHPQLDWFAALRKKVRRAVLWFLSV